MIDLLKKYGAIEKKTENGVNYSLTPEQITEEFLSEQKELSEVECILHVDPVDFNFIVNLETQVNYTFDLLQPFFENFA